MAWNLELSGVDNWGEEPSNYHIHIENQVEKWRGSESICKSVNHQGHQGTRRKTENKAFVILGVLGGIGKTTLYPKLKEYVTQD